MLPEWAARASTTTGLMCRARRGRFSRLPLAAPSDTNHGSKTSRLRQVGATEYAGTPPEEGPRRVHACGNLAFPDLTDLSPPPLPDLSQSPAAWHAQTSWRFTPGRRRRRRFTHLAVMLSPDYRCRSNSRQKGPKSAVHPRVYPGLYGYRRSGDSLAFRRLFRRTRLWPSHTQPGGIIAW